MNLIKYLLLIIIYISCNEIKTAEHQCNRQIILASKVNFLLEKTIQDYKISEQCFLTLSIKNISPKETLFTIRPYYKVSEDYNDHYFFTKLLGINIYIANEIDQFVNYKKDAHPIIYEFNCTDFIAKQYFELNDTLYEIDNKFDSKNDEIINISHSSETRYFNDYNICEYNCFSNFRNKNIKNIKILKILK